MSKWFKVTLEVEQDVFVMVEDDQDWEEAASRAEDEANDYGVDLDRFAEWTSKREEEVSYEEVPKNLRT